VAAQDSRGEDKPNAYSLDVHSAARRLGVCLYGGHSAARRLGVSLTPRRLGVDLAILEA
jgi:hypothetical protein